MIHVDRGPTPPSLDGSNSVGGQEKRDAIKALATGKMIKFVAYKKPDVVKALRAAFNKKCAYCEFNYAAGASEDIEHFRPKLAVVIDGKMAQPGYYWLAADWSNLLPSCQDCNRKRTKDFPESKRGVSGKANLFPIENEEHRWRSHGRKNREKALLLNPCDDNPADHLDFMDMGLVRPVRDSNGVESTKGAVSIEIYGLLRGDLVEQRAGRQTMVRATLARAFDAAASAKQTADPQARRDFERLAADLLKDAQAYLGGSEPFHAAVAAVFREYGLKAFG